MKLSSLLDGVLYKGNADVEIKDIVCASNKVTKESAFVCIVGYSADGHNFALQAEKNGASVIVALHDIEGVSIPVVVVEDTRKVLGLICSRFLGEPSKKFTLIGVTGTNGKTTTTYLIKSILEHKGHKVGLIGTNQNMIGSEVIATDRTTPDGFELQKLFKKMADNNCDTVVMEVSSHALYLDRVYGSDFDIGLFTNITQDHLDFHKTMENYLEAKTLLFKMCKKGVVNKDDENSQYVLDNATCKMVSYSIDNESDAKATNVVMEQNGVSFDALGQNFTLNIPGRFSVYNAMGAILVCKELGIEPFDIAIGLKKAQGVRGRAQVVDMGTDFTVIIDYAHTPDGIENILKTVNGFKKGRSVILFGCGGDRDNKKRPIMGEIATRLADYTIITSDNPRTENPTAIINEIVEGIHKDKPYKIIENRKDAIVYAIKNAKKNDVIILAGKGHETYQTIGTENFHFNEEEILLSIKKDL